uniref:Uncharacterized protein n=1 Tax=Nucleocytoviricota sp. TaxID=2809609 RepID=A0A9E8G4H9_9VIRU|nr:hypothetical protein [Nucleocytoviricota sp.]UZT29052.1 hypothetical protein [Nucleocytoviricota sp.]
MTIFFDLEKVRNDHNCKIYFETGLWDSNTNNSCKQALQCNFNKVYSTEIREDFINIAKKVFINDIQNKRLILIHDDSSNLKKYLNETCFDNNRVLFYLDAHVDNQNIKNFKNRCPLFEELNAIKNMKTNDNIILIDDLRILNHKHPWNETSYGNINFINEIKKLILQINSQYKFKTLCGVVENDVLMAYI